MKDRKDDLYETPAICVEAALRAGVFAECHGAGPIWEPCAGRGAIARELRKAGWRVVAQDLVDHPGRDDGIVTGVDFLMEARAPEGCATIITNPPFKLADAFIRHGLGLGCRGIVLLRAMAIEGAGRSDLIDRHLRRYWIRVDRLSAMHREGWTGNRLTNSGASFAWFDFSPEPRGRGEPIELRRFWWDAAKALGGLFGDAE